MHCYAEATDQRFRYGGQLNWGPKAPRFRTGVANWRKPVQWNAAAAKLKKRHLVFCASLADVFEGRAELKPWRDELFQLVENTPALTWLMLTKRPENILDMLPDRWLASFPANIWLGTTVEDVKRKERIDTLRAARAPLTVDLITDERRPLAWLSLEPLLEDLGDLDLRGIAWAIVGGESEQFGQPARPFDLAWARKIRAQCTEQRVAYFFKQKGNTVTDDGEPILCDGKGADPAQWPASISGQEFPEARTA